MSSLLKKLFDSHLVPPGIPCSKNITNNENERSKFKVTLRTITHFKSYLILSNNSALSDAIIPTIETIYLSKQSLPFVTSFKQIICYDMFDNGLRYK